MNNLNCIADGPVFGLWVDDLRPLPSDLQLPQWENDDVANGWPHFWVYATTFHDAIFVLESCPQIKYVSLDHDLASYYGNKEMTGFDVLWWMVDRKVNRPDECKVEQIKVHSANPSAKPKMIETIEQYWSEHD